MPGLKLFAFGKFFMGCCSISRLSVWVILGHPTKRTHMVVSDSTRTTWTRTPSRNRSFVCCKISMLRKSSKKFRISILDCTDLRSLRVYVRRCSGSAGNRAPFYIATVATSIVFRSPFELNRFFYSPCFTLFFSSQYFITVLTIYKDRIYSLFLIRQCQISIVVFR